MVWTDGIARLIAQPLAASFGQPFVIDTKPGANGVIAAELVAKAPPDGYTLLMVTVSQLGIRADLPVWAEAVRISGAHVDEPPRLVHPRSGQAAAGRDARDRTRLKQPGPIFLYFQGG